MNKIEKLQNQLNDACQEVFENFLESGKSYDFTLMKEVVAGEVSEEYYNTLLDDDDDELLDRITDNGVWCEEYLDSDFYARAHCICVGVSSNKDVAHATIYNEYSGECFELPLWHFIPDMAERVFTLMNNE
jgi:hypothetical protein